MALHHHGEAKSNELREAATVMAQTHSRTMDRKNALLQSLETEVDDAETQHRRAASDPSRVETLLRLHANRARETSDRFPRRMRGSWRRLSKTNDSKSRKNTPGTEEICWMFWMRWRRRTSVFSCVAALGSRLRAKRSNREREAFENAKNKLEAAVRACERMCEDAHKTYVSGTDTRAASFEQLTARDSQSARTIESRMRDLGRLARRVRRAKGMLESQSREWRAKNKALRKEKERVRDHAHALAATTERGRAEANAKLKALLARVQRRA